MKFQFQIKLAWVLGAITILLFAGLIWFYSWGIGALIGSFEEAFNASPASNANTQFQSDTAQKILRDRGIMQ